MHAAWNPSSGSLLYRIQGKCKRVRIRFSEKDVFQGKICAIWGPNRVWIIKSACEITKGGCVEWQPKYADDLESAYILFLPKDQITPPQVTGFVV